MERRTATSMPPAETLRAVANSRNSLSASDWLRTKTGTARGKRGQRRRSVDGVLPFKPNTHPFLRTIAQRFKHLRGQNLNCRANPRTNPGKSGENQVNFGCSQGLKSVKCGFSMPFACTRRLPLAMPQTGAQSTVECRVLPHLGNQVAFFIDRKTTLAYDFCKAFFLTSRVQSPLFSIAALIYGQRTKGYLRSADGRKGGHGCARGSG